MVTRRNSRRQSGTSVAALARAVRSLQVLLLHPKSDEGEDLLRHLERIGCRVETRWPPPRDIPSDVDFVFLAVRPIVEGEIDFDWNAEDPPAVLIAVVDYENPVVVAKVLDLKAQAVIGLPLRPFGVLANLLLSLTNHKREQRLKSHVKRLSAKLKAKRDIDRAKSILISTHRISEERAYEIIREQAMNKRTTIEAIASSIINASDALRLDLTDGE